MWAVEAFRNHEKIKILGNRSPGNKEFEESRKMDQVFRRIPGSLMAL